MCYKLDWDFTQHGFCNYKYDLEEFAEETEEDVEQSKEKNYTESTPR